MSITRESTFILVGVTLSITLLHCWGGEVPLDGPEGGIGPPLGSIPNLEVLLVP